MSPSKRTTYLVVGAVIAAAAFGVLYFTNAIATVTEVGKATAVDFSAYLPTNNVTVAKGKSVTVPVEIYGAKEKAKDLKIYIGEPEQPTSVLQTIKDAKTSAGITVTPDKTEIKLAALSETGIAQRDALTMSIKADQSATEGIHTLAITLVDQDGSFMTTYFRLNVE